MAIERRTRQDLAAALAEQRAAIIDPARAADDAVDFMRRDFERLMYELMLNPQMRDRLRRGMIGSVDLGIQVAIDQFNRIGFGFDWTLANAAARDWANDYVGELITNIDATTQRLTRQAVREWIDNGQPLDDLVDELAPIFSRDRADLIASTEVTRAYAEGNRQAYLASGVVQRWEWRTANDELVCPICRPLNNTQVTIGTGFEGFLPDDVRVSRGFDAPPGHPRCRCWIVPVIEDVPNA